MAHRVRKALSELGINVEVDVNYDAEDNLSYQCSNQKLAQTLGFTPQVSIEEGAREIAEMLQQGWYRDFDHPIYYNLPWMQPGYEDVYLV